MYSVVILGGGGWRWMGVEEGIERINGIGKQLNLKKSGHIGNEIW